MGRRKGRRKGRRPRPFSRDIGIRCLCCKTPDVFEGKAPERELCFECDFHINADEYAKWKNLRYSHVCAICYCNYHSLHLFFGKPENAQCHGCRRKAVTVVAVATVVAADAAATAATIATEAALAATTAALTATDALKTAIIASLHAAALKSASKRV